MNPSLSSHMATERTHELQADAANRRRSRIALLRSRRASARRAADA